MLDIRLIERGLEKPGKTKGGLATAMGVRPGAVSEILSGIRLIKASEIAPIIEYLELNSVPIMGRAVYPNLYLNVGHGHVGWTMCCGSGKFVADLVAGREPEIDPEGLLYAA